MSFALLPIHDITVLTVSDQILIRALFVNYYINEFMWECLFLLNLNGLLYNDVIVLTLLV